MSKIYVIRQIGVKKEFEITSFEESKEPTGVYTVKITSRAKSCSCNGFYRQRDKTEHKHIKLVNFWIKSLDKIPGFVFWWEGEDLEYSKAFDMGIVNDFLEKYS